MNMILGDSPAINMDMMQGRHASINPHALVPGKSTNFRGIESEQTKKLHSSDIHQRNA